MEALNWVEFDVNIGVISAQSPEEERFFLCLSGDLYYAYRNEPIQLLSRNNVSITTHDKPWHV
jgi:hypothetical protein